MRLLLDSTVLIDVLRGRTAALSLLTEAVRSGHELGTSAINLAEVYSGMRAGEESKTQAFLENITCFPITPAIGERGGRLRNTWARKGITLGLADMVIAATALDYGLTLVTDNRKDFPMPEISFYPPSQSASQ